jgi:hypothetical protein
MQYLITNYSQQDATFLEFINFYRRSACFRQYWLTIPEAVCTVMCSWWWAEESLETCRASVKINKFKKRCILLAVICNYIVMHGHMNIKYAIFLWHFAYTIILTLTYWILGVSGKFPNVSHKNFPVLPWSYSALSPSKTHMTFTCVFLMHLVQKYVK